MIKDKWMTRFYNRPWYILNDTNYSELPQGMIEARINAIDHLYLIKMLNRGFTLVETAVEFQTKISKPIDGIPNYCRKAQIEDIEQIIEVIRVCYTDNERFYNRFKLRQFFTREQSNDYYIKSFTTAFKEKESVTIVVEDEFGICGFYTMKKIDTLLYKGVITGVHPRKKGNNLHVAMQLKCYEIVGSDYIVINRTQLGNYRVLNNHIKQKRNLTKVEHILYFPNFSN
jgi:hypothetical protein